MSIGVFDVHGYKLSLDTSEGMQKAMSVGLHEPEQTAWVRSCLKPGDVFVDAGANFGWFSFLAAKQVGELGRVYAFEPSPLASQELLKNVVSNGISNVVVEASGLGAVACEIDLYLPVNSSLHSPSAFPSNPDFRPFSVPVTSLDDYFKSTDLDVIKLIKIDCEGFEPNIVDGMKNLLAAGKVSNIVCELNSGWLRRNNTTPLELKKKIEDFGFVELRKTDLKTHPESEPGVTFSVQDIWYEKK